MIRKNNITMEYEFEGERIKYTTDENGKIIKADDGKTEISWHYNELGKMCTDRININKENYIFIYKWVLLCPEIIICSDFISYIIELDKLGLTVTLDSNDKITKIKGKNFEYDFDYIEESEIYNLTIKDNTIKITNKLIDNAYCILRGILELLILDKEGKKDLLYDELVLNRVQLAERFHNINNYKEEFLKDFHKNKELKDGDKMKTNKSEIDLEESENSILNNKSKVEYTLEYFNNHKNEILDSIFLANNKDKKMTFDPNEFPGFFKDPKENKRIMLSDLFKLEKSVEIIKSLERFSYCLSKDEIKEIALNKIFYKFPYNNFDISIFNKDCLKNIMKLKNININVLLDKNFDCIIKYNEILGNNKKSIAFIDFNLNNKYVFFIEDIDNKINTLLLYVPDLYPITYSKDIMDTIKKYNI